MQFIWTRVFNWRLFLAFLNQLIIHLLTNRPTATEVNNSMQRHRQHLLSILLASSCLFDFIVVKIVSPSEAKTNSNVILTLNIVGYYTILFVVWQKMFIEPKFNNNLYSLHSV